MTLEVFLDDTPGETRGVVVRDGRYERLIIQRESDPPQHRLGARCMGRVTDVDAGLAAAFVDLGPGVTPGFLSLGKGAAPRRGESVEVEVSAEPREAKGPTLRRIGLGEGAPRLLAPGPDVAAVLAALAPGAPVQAGLAAVRASLEAEEEALAPGGLFREAGVDLAVQRTRALVAVDIDHAPAPGRDARKGRDRANRLGLVQAARLIRLKAWGGLVAIDLIGTNPNPETVGAAARDAFAGDGAAFGPVSRFGLLQLALPWRRTPVDERAAAADPAARAIALTRRLREALLSDTTAPRWIARCAPVDAETAAPFVARLGARAGLARDPELPPGRFVIEEG